MKYEFELLFSVSREVGSAGRGLHLHPSGEDFRQWRCDCHLLVLLPRSSCPRGHCSRENLLRNLLDKNNIFAVIANGFQDHERFISVRKLTINSPHVKYPTYLYTHGLNKSLHQILRFKCTWIKSFH